MNWSPEAHVFEHTPQLVLLLQEIVKPLNCGIWLAEVGQWDLGFEEYTYLWFQSELCASCLLQ